MSLSEQSKTILTLINESKLLILSELYSCLDPLCGCDLIERLQMPKNLLSYHIRTLRETGFLEEARCGQKKQYRITESKREKVKQILLLTEII